jgi:hypothetical protein
MRHNHTHTYVHTNEQTSKKKEYTIYHFNPFYHESSHKDDTSGNYTLDACLPCLHNTITVFFFSHSCFSIWSACFSLPFVGLSVNLFEKVYMFLNRNTQGADNTINGIGFYFLSSFKFFVFFKDIQRIRNTEKKFVGRLDVVVDACDPFGKKHEFHFR